MKKLCTALFVIFSFPGYSQLTGIKNIPGDYATIAAAVAALNTSGVGAGGVVINIAAGHIETSDIPAITVTGTASNQIVFQKSGLGADPKIIPLTPGTMSPLFGEDGDGIIVLVGGDYITFDGIDLQTDPLFTGPGMMDYGFYFKHASNSDGCQNITIKNCSVTLNKAADNSFGIFVSNILGTMPATGFMSITGNHKIYNNTISNCYGGIEVYSYLLPNEIGVDGGNTISDYTGYGIHAMNQNNLKIANNIIDKGAGSTGPFGIYITRCNFSDVAIYSNIISLAPSPTDANAYAIYNEQTTEVPNATNTVSIYNNTIQNSSWAPLGATSFNAIANTSPCFNLNIYGNKIINNHITENCSFYGIYDQRVDASTEDFHDNEISGNSLTGTSGNFTGIYAYQFSGQGRLIHNDSISSNNGPGSVIGISTNRGFGISLYKNKIYDLSGTGTSSTVVGIFLFGPGDGSSDVTNNLIGDLKTPDGSADNSIIGLSVITTGANVYYNTIYLNAGSTQPVFGSSAIYYKQLSGSILLIQNNIIANTSIANGTGKTVALRMALMWNQPAQNSYSPSSNNNLFYAGNPSPANLIMYDGTNADQTLAAFKSRVSPIESVSISENPNFLSTTGSSSEFLHVNPAIPTDIESGGQLIAGYADDYDEDIRQGSPGYIGTGSRPDIGADEFEGLRISGPLPVTLLSFNVSQSSPHHNMISWSTSQEINTSLFVIERSNNGRNFSEIGQVHAAGNSNNSLNYNFVDSTPSKGINYYRLKMIDRDYNIKYSGIKSIKNIGQTDFTISPNPVNEIIKVVLNAEDAGTATLLINDGSGRLLVKKHLNFQAGINIYPVDVNTIAKGIYVISLQIGEYTIVKKFNKM